MAHRVRRHKGGHTKLRVNESVIQAEVDDEILLLDVEKGTYFGLDGVGTRIWQLLGNGATPEAIVGALGDEYEVDQAQLQADVSCFLDTLQGRGLIYEVPE